MVLCLGSLGSLVKGFKRWAKITNLGIVLCFGLGLREWIWIRVSCILARELLRRLLVLEMCNVAAKTMVVVGKSSWPKKAVGM